MTVLPQSERGRALLSPGAMNAILREAGTHAGEQWIATFLPLRFDRAYALGLGYRTSQRTDPWHTKEPERWPATYDDRKQQWQGHDEALVWTGRLRAEIYNWVSTRVASTKGQLRVEITFGRLNVGSERSGYRQLPADSIVRQTLTAFPPNEQEAVTSQLVAYVGTRLGAITAPVRSAARLPPPPPVLADQSQRDNAARVAAGMRARQINGTIAERIRARLSGRLDRWQAWRGDAGGSSPLGQAPRSPAEAKLAHRAQAKASYHRNRAAILARRRARRGVAAALDRVITRLQGTRP